MRHIIAPKPESVKPINRPSDAGAPIRSLAEWMLVQADRYASYGTDAGRLAADALYGVYRDLLATEATTAEQHYDRLDTLRSLFNDARA